MNKRYYLKNEKGQILDINDMRKSVFNLTSDTGTSKNLYYNRIGSAFLKSKEEMKQLIIEGNLTFIQEEGENEQNYKAYESFLRTSENITFVNIRKEDGKLIESYVDVDWAQIGRALKNGSKLVSKLVLYCKTAWYKQDNICYTIEEEQINAFGFPIDFEKMTFGTGENSSNIINNPGYTDAPLYVNIKGAILNPKIEVIKNKEVINSIEIPIELSSYEEIEYCTRDDRLLLRKINEDGTYSNLFDLIDETNTNNFFKIPTGASMLRISADTDIKYASVIIYIQY